MNANARRVCLYGASLTLFGIIVSGPLALLVVDATHPQPPWESAALFARSYHAIQSAPFFGGFCLVAGFVVMMAGLHAAVEGRERALATAALVFTAVYAAMVSTNYVLQTTFVPELARHYTPQSDAILATFSMSNPSSLAWGLEMWGYGFLGAATWLVAPVIAGSRASTLERATAWTFIANGPASILPAILTAIRPGWVMTTPGMVGFVVWNVLVLAMTVLAILVFAKERTAGERGGVSIRLEYSRAKAG